MADTKTLYDHDFVAWTVQQGAALRSAAQGATNQKLDWENLAEEIESLGRSDRRELHSQIYRIIQHLVKLQFSPASEPKRGWHNSIEDARKEVELVLADSPSLKPQLPQIVSDQTAGAIKRALFDLREYGDVDRTTEQAVRRTRYAVDQVLGDWFPPGAIPQSPAGDTHKSR